MRIFSNFDTQYKRKTIDKLSLEFGEGHIVVLQKSKLFWFLKIFLPFIFLLAILFGLMYGTYQIFAPKWMRYIGLPVSLILFCVVGWPIFKNYLDYTMDFTIITPKLLIRYNQEGLRNRNVQTINDTNIRTVTVERKGLIYSIFNNGDITFLSEATDIIHGEITLHYIYKPESKRRKIARAMERI